MDRLRQESTPATRSWRPESILRHGAQTARAALSFLRFDHLQPSPQVMWRLRPGVAGGLPVHGDGGRDGGNAAENRTRASQGLAKEDHGNVRLGLVQKQLRSLRRTHPHPGPLPSDGRGRTVLSRLAYPTAVEGATDGSGCSLSRRPGEGQGEGHFV